MTSRNDYRDGYRDGYKDGYRDACAMLADLAANASMLAEAHAVRAEMERQREEEKC